MIAQRSDDWYEARLGKVTASRVADVMSYLKSGEPSKARQDYLKELVVERLTGLPAKLDPYITQEMQWGIANEMLAKSLYTIRTGQTIEEAPFVESELFADDKDGKPTNRKLQCGASPDGFIGEDGNVEVKCLTTKNHLYSVFMENTYPEEYRPQIMMQMWVTGRQWTEFIAYDSRLPEGLDLFIQRVERDEEYIAMLEQEVREFLAQVDRNVGHFLSFVPIKERVCLECGVVFADKMPRCNSCGSRRVKTNG